MTGTTATQRRWRALVAGWTASGLSCKAYAAKAAGWTVLTTIPQWIGCSMSQKGGPHATPATSQPSKPARGPVRMRLIYRVHRERPRDEPGERSPSPCTPVAIADDPGSGALDAVGRVLLQHRV